MMSEPVSPDPVGAEQGAAAPASNSPSFRAAALRIFQRRDLIGRRLVRWYVSPSGVLFLVSLALAAASLAGVPGSRWYGFLALAAVAAFVPYRFSREQVRNDRRLDVRARALDRALEHSVGSLRQAAAAVSSRLNATEEEITIGKDELERTARLIQTAEERLSDLGEVVAHLGTDAERLGVETKRQRQSIEKQSFEAVRTREDLSSAREDLDRERNQRVEVLANALDTVSASFYPSSGDSYVVGKSAASQPMKGRRLIFAASSGRAGSHYLAQLLGSARNVYATHESPPYMISHHLRAVLERPLAESYDRRHINAVAIQSILAALPRHVLYAETNHMFIKIFHDVVINEFDPAGLTVVLLRRRLDKVLRSFLELGYFTQDNVDWVHWMHEPHGANLIAQTPAPIGDLDDVDRAIGYLFDIEARMQRFVTDYPGLKVVEAVLEEISTEDGAGRLLEHLELKPTSQTEVVVGRPTNSRTVLKLWDVDLDECRSRILATPLVPGRQASSHLSFRICCPINRLGSWSQPRLCGLRRRCRNLQSGFHRRISCRR